VKSIRGYCKCPRENFNNVASYSWIVAHLVANYKANPNITLQAMPDKIMEKYGLEIKNHTLRGLENYCSTGLKAVMKNHTPSYWNTLRKSS